MVGKYEVYLLDRPVGTVTVERQGLYYCFSCRCVVNEKGMYRLLLRSGGREADLGLCVPMADGFGTEKRLPVKQCSAGKPEFLLRPRGGQFVPISPEEPFRYIHRLENAFLERRDGRLGIVIR